MSCSPRDELADWLERHEEYWNAENARVIGGEVWERADALVIFSRPELGTGLNFAGRIRSDDDRASELVDEIVDWFTQRNVRPHVRISPLSRPAQMAYLLARRGFVRTEAETQMVRAGADEGPPANAAVSIKRVGAADVETWAAVQFRGFGGNGAPPAITVELAHAAVGMQRVRLFLAHLDGAAVGASMLAAWEGVQGIYGVATLPEQRCKGVGTAIVRRMVLEAREVDHSPVCLQVGTGSEAQRWYERLGFRVVYDRTGWTLPTT